MYSWNNKTEAISARLMPGLKDRIDFECQQYPGMNRNKFLNYAAEFFLLLHHEYKCGNIKWEDIPPILRTYMYC